MRIFKVVATVLTVALICLTSDVFAQEEIKTAGTVIKSTGDVKITRAGKDFNAVESFALQEKDVLVTGKESFVIVKMIDKSTLQLGSDSKIMINVASFSKEKKSTEVQLFTGKVRAKVRRLRRADTFRVKTPTAVVAVRGTHFLTGLKSVKVFSGNVLLKTAIGEIMLKANQMAGIAPNGQIGKIVPIPKNDPEKKMRRPRLRARRAEAPENGNGTKKAAGNALNKDLQTEKSKDNLNPAEQAGGAGKVVPPSKVVQPVLPRTTTTIRRGCR